MNVSLSSAPALEDQLVNRAKNPSSLVVHDRVDIRNDPFLIGSLDSAQKLLLCSPLGTPFTLLIKLSKVPDIIDIVPCAFG